jgi:FkbM family methyltransferase
MKLLEQAYAAAKRAGLLEQPWFGKVYLQSYFAYKRWLEDPFHGLVASRPELLRGGHVLDVGANVGYTASVFARALDPGRKVYAFEPDVTNYDFLVTALRTAGIEDRVVPILSAVGETQGTVELWLNATSNADHRIATETFKPGQTRTVPCVTVDGFAKAQGIAGEIAFVKIDVQGFEPPVLRGMKATIEANPKLAIVVEYAPAHVRELGFEPKEIVSTLAAQGFVFDLIAVRKAPERVTAEQILAAGEKHYVDVLCTRS